MTVKSDVKIDWQVCALGLNKKLNLIAAKLKQSVKENSSLGIAHYAQELLDTFKLDTDLQYSSVDFDELVSSFKEVSDALNKAYWSRFTVKQDAIGLAMQKSSDFSFKLSLMAAFQPLKKEL